MFYPSIKLVRISSEVFDLALYVVLMTSYFSQGLNFKSRLKSEFIHIDDLYSFRSG